MKINPRKVQNRIEWIDIAKGLSIFLVVIGHTGIPKLFSDWIWSFHMPFFFLVSGLLYNSTKYPTTYSFFKRRMLTLIMPYFIFSILVYAWAQLLNYEQLRLQFHELYLGWNGIALWFIPVLFFTEISYYFIEKYFMYIYYVLPAIIALSILGYFSYLNDFHLPFKLEVVPTAILFYGIGNLCSKYIILYFERIKSSLLLVGLLLLLGLSLYISTNNNPRLDMACNIIGHFVPTYIAAFLGISFMFVLSVIISNINVGSIVKIKYLISYIGKNTFIILALHQIVLMTFKRIFNQYSIPSYLSFGIRQLLLWSFLLVSIYSINRYSPWVLGKKK